MSDKLNDLIPELVRGIFGTDLTTPSVTLELTQLEVNALYRVGLRTWSMGANEKKDSLGKAMLPYVESRLAYIRQFISDDDIEAIENEVCPEASLLHD